MKSVFLAIAIFLVPLSFLINKEINGVVTDDGGEPLFGANVVVKGTEVGCITDVDGKFKLTIPEEIEDPILTISYLGYDNKEVRVKQFDKLIKVSLSSSVRLDEVVVSSTESKNKDTGPGLFNTLSKSKKSKSEKSSRDKALYKESEAPAPDARYSLETAAPSPSSPTAATMPSSTVTESVGHSKEGEPTTLRGAREVDDIVFVDGVRTKATTAGVISSKPINSSIKLGGTPASMETSDKTTFGDELEDEDYRLEKEEMLIDPETVAEINEDYAKTLTAGEINDFSKWDMWNDLTADELAGFATRWKIAPSIRYSVKVKTSSGAPAINNKVELHDASGAVLWSAITDNTGRAELWHNMNGAQEKAKQLVVHYEGGSTPIKNIKAFKNGINSIELPIACKETTPVIDIAFVVDATGSMADEINYLKAELKDVINQVKEELPESVVRTGSVFYRDHGDDYVTRNSDFSKDISKTVSFIAQQYARGGGDFPEAVDDALEVAVNDLNWSETSTSKILFLILDAPPHSRPENTVRIQEATKLAAQKGIRIIPITCSGIQKGTEYLMRALALATNGTYTFLTDDSGVGNPHLEPSTDNYSVELLNYLMIRLITEYSEIQECEEDYSQTIIDINEQNTQSDLIWEYYPNPTQGRFTVKAEKQMEEILIADMNGKLLMRKNTDALVEDFDITAFPSGVYIIRVHFDEKTWETGRIVLVHER